MNGNPIATVAILTFNGETYLERILVAVESQEIEGDVEILIIDSGSTDATLEIVARHPRVRLHQIPNAEFGHGKTRNLAAQLATGEFVVYLTHDAIPIGPHWLREMLRPFAISTSIAGVVGKQVPRASCFPLLKYEIDGVFRGLGGELGVTVTEHPAGAPEDGLLDARAFYSDVNSAARREFLVSSIPYRDVRYAEDQLFGRDILLAGWRKAYTPTGAVEHSNDLTLEEYERRIFDETVGLREIGREMTPIGVRDRLRGTARGVIGDTVRIMQDPAFGRRRKLYWLVLNPRYHWVKWRALRAATTVDLADEAARSAGSLEARRRELDERER